MGATPGDTRALYQAIRRGDVAEVSRLVDAGADLDGEDAIGWTPLMLAASSGDAALVQAVLRRASPASSRGRALVEAAAQGHVRAVELLLDAGADPAFTTERGNNALGIAKKRRRKEVVALLAARGASVAKARAVKRGVPAAPAVLDRTNRSHAPLVARLKGRTAAERRAAADAIAETRDRRFEGAIVAALARELTDTRPWRGQCAMADALAATSASLEVATWLERILVEVRFEATMVPKSLGAAAHHVAVEAGAGDLGRLLTVVLDRTPATGEKLGALTGVLGAVLDRRPPDGRCPPLDDDVARRVASFLADPGELPRHGEAMLERAREAWRFFVPFR